MFTKNGGEKPYPPGSQSHYPKKFLSLEPHTY